MLHRPLATKLWKIRVAIDQEIAMLRSDLRSNRKQVIAANMKLTDAEAEKFWPIYDQYVNELVKINGAKYALIKEYLQNTNMTDEQADGLSKRWVDVDASVAQLRLKYIPIFRKVLSARGTAMFFQIDRRVQMMIDDDRSTTGKLNSAYSALAPGVSEACNNRLISSGNRITGTLQDSEWRQGGCVSH